MIDLVRDAIEYLKEASAAADEDYYSTCSEVWVEEETEDEDFEGNRVTFLESVPYRKDDGDPQILEFKSRLDTHIQGLEALVQEFEFFDPPELD